MVLINTHKFCQAIRHKYYVNAVNQYEHFYIEMYDHLTWYSPFCLDSDRPIENIQVAWMA